ncbi:site-specific integrase [Myroides sp. C15-4]|uniref:site-specific integrase n=1 Tax=Myroides sp. C15-4 TaxID=3400532 RepID=UPI003D2F71EB
MPEAKFVLKEPKSDNKTLIYLFYNFGNKRFKYSTGEKIHPKFWNTNKQRVKESSRFPEYPEFNTRLNNIETAINNCYRRLNNDNVVITTTLLRKELNMELKVEERKAKPKDFLVWLEDYIDTLKLTHKKGSIQVYEALFNHLIAFASSRKYNLTFETINMDFYNQFQDYILNEKKLLTNTFGKQISTLKTFLNIATELGINKSLAYKSRLFKAPEEKVNHIYLSEEELKLMEDVDLSEIPYLDRVRDFFLIGCHTGLRFSDFTQLKKENFEKKGGKLFFNVITHKTKERVVIPVKSVIEKISMKYDWVFPRAISNQKMNKYLKELGKIAKIETRVIRKEFRGGENKEELKFKYDLITTHTARRSFATNAYLAGVPTLSIMKLTGHTTESSFMKYIKVSQELNAELLSDHPFFK